MSAAAENAKVDVRRGMCRPLFAFDVALAIDLVQAEKLLAAAAAPAMLGSVRNSPTYFEYRPRPLRATLPVESIGIGEASLGFRTAAQIELTAFDFGAVCVSYTIPLAEPDASRSLDDLIALSLALFENPSLLAHARAKVEQFVGAIAGAMTKPGWAQQVEDYIVYEIAEVEIDGQRPRDGARALLTAAPSRLARVLRAERSAMSESEVGEALSHTLSYRPDDAAVVDWNAAVLLDDDAEELRPVLEFANVELLEMRYLDDRLDEIIDQAYRASQERRVGWRAVFPGGSGRLRRIAQLQLDSAVLFEGVNNALKLIGDQYLARVYRMTAKRFHLPERDSTIERKLSTLESIYSKMSDHEATRRAEMLEWIIIALIAFEVVFGLLRL